MEIGVVTNPIAHAPRSNAHAQSAADRFHHFSIAVFTLFFAVAGELTIHCHTLPTLLIADHPRDAIDQIGQPNDLASRSIFSHVSISHCVAMLPYFVGSSATTVAASYDLSAPVILHSHASHGMLRFGITDERIGVGFADFAGAGFTTTSHLVANFSGVFNLSSELMAGFARRASAIFLGEAGHTGDFHFVFSYTILLPRVVAHFHADCVSLDNASFQVVAINY